MAVLAWAQQELALGMWPILTDGHTHAHSMVSWHAVCVTTGCPQPRAASGARYTLTHLMSGPPAQTKHHDMIEVMLDDPLCLSLSKLSYSFTTLLATGGDVTSIKQSSRNESEHARYMRCVSSTCRAYSDLSCLCMPVIREWSNGRLGSVWWAPWLSPILTPSGTWRDWIIDGKHKLFTQPPSLHQHC